MRQLLDEARALQEEMVRNRRWLHQHPEVGFDLKETTAYVRARLEEMGYVVEDVCECGLVTLIGDPTSGPCVLLRADMDALPIAEESGVEFCSTNGNMHACGHDTHITMLLGAARLLKTHEAELKGCVKLVFQPDEEACAPVDYCGADALLAAGTLQNPTVDAVFAQHILTVDLPAGKVALRQGAMFSSVDDLDIVVHGKSAHGAKPHQGVDALNIACHIYLGLQNMIARELDPEDQAVITIGTIEGGTAANILPGEVHMLGTLRTVEQETRQRMQDRIVAMCDGIASGFGGSAEVQFLRGLPPVKNDAALTQQAAGFIENLTGEAPVLLAKPLSVSDDLAVLSQEVPTTYFVLGSGSAEEGSIYPLHNPKIVFNEDVFPLGSALLANCAIEYLNAH